MFLDPDAPSSELTVTGPVVAEAGPPLICRSPDGPSDMKVPDTVMPLPPALSVVPSIAMAVGSDIVKVSPATSMAG